MIKKEQGLLVGTIFLLCSNIFVKGLGFAYRMIITRLIGVEGMGLIEMITPLYSFLLVIAGLGLQLALSQSTAAKPKGSGSDFYTARKILLISGAIISLSAFIFAPFIIDHFASDRRIYLGFVAILPAVFIISAASAYRGYLQGNKQIAALGSSQAVEQTIRFICGIYLISRLGNLSLEQAVAGASYATVLGELAGFLYLVFFMRHLGAPPKQRFNRQKAANLLHFGLPITFGRLATSIIMMLQALLIPLCLQQAGWDMRAATEMYGRLAGVALSLIHLPGVFTSALAMAVMPAIAEQSSGNILQRRANHALQASTVLALPGMLILFFLAEPLCTLLFDAPLAAPILQILTIGGCFFHPFITLSSILQGLGEVKALLINNILAGIILVLSILILVPRSYLGIYGAAIAINACWISGFIFNLVHFLHISKLKLNWRDIIGKPFAIMLLSGLIFYFSRAYLPILNQGEAVGQIISQSIYLSILYFGGLMMVKGLSIGLWRRIRPK